MFLVLILLMNCIIKYAFQSMIYSKDEILFDIKSLLISKKNLRASLYKLQKIMNKSDEITNFYDKDIPKVDSSHTCLAVSSSNFVLNKDENNYLQWFLKYCTYIKKTLIRHVIN